MENKEKISADSENQTQGVLNFDLPPNSETQNKKSHKKRNIIIVSVIAILVIIVLAILSQRNVIMGNMNCKSGDYQTAATYYAKAISDGNDSENIKKIYKALTAYIDAEKAYSIDDMGTLATNLDILQETKSQYPTQEEIRILKNQYTKRNDEIISYDKSIEEITALFTDTTKMEEIKSKCDELLEQNITAIVKLPCASRYHGNFTPARFASSRPMP